MNSFWTVVSFTFLGKVKRKAFIVTTLILALIIAIGVNLPYIIAQFNNDDGAANQRIIGYTTADSTEQAVQEFGPNLEAYLEKNPSKGFMLKAYDDQGSAEANVSLLKQKLQADEISGYLTLGQVTDSGFPAITFNSTKLLDYEVMKQLESALEEIRLQNIFSDISLPDAQRAQLMAPIQMDLAQITVGQSGDVSGKSTEEQAVNMGLIYFITFALFMAIMITGQMIATEITTEKNTRVMEILITSVAPLAQMFGKIFGMFLVGFVQIFVLLAVIFANISLPHNQEAFGALSIDISAIDPILLMYALFFYIAGYFLFATLFAAVGSIVSRTEDLGQAVMPITLISLAGFYIAMFSLTNPDSMLVKVTSFIPFTSPYVMMLRLGLSNPAAWEVALSVALLLVTTYIMGWISTKIYRVGVLMYGKRPSWKEVFKAIKAYKV